MAHMNELSTLSNLFSDDIKQHTYDTSLTYL
jgi:hypothetical protein